MTVAVLVVEWPFLFKEQHFFNHAQELLGFNVEDRLNSALQNKGTRLITFFRSEKSTCKSMRLVNQLIEGHHGSLLPAVLMGLMAYFKEDSNCTLIAAEVSECFSSVVWLLPPKSLCSSLCYLWTGLHITAKLISIKLGWGVGRGTGKTCNYLGHQSRPWQRYALYSVPV